MSMLAKAIRIAAQAHENQVDKGGNPYVLHCLEVLRLVQSDSEEVKCIAVLHDVIEDTKITYDELRAEGMSERVIRGIEALTKQKGESYAACQEKVRMNPDAILVKMADLTHNSDIRRIKGATIKDFERSQEYMKFYYNLKALVNG